MRHAMRIYCAESLYPTAKIFLSDEKYHHAKNVMRLADKSHCLAFNPDDGEFKAVLEYQKKQAILHIGDNSRPPLPTPQSPVKIWLFCPVLKRDKMGFIVEKSVELGVDAIQPIHMSQTAMAKGHEKFHGDKLMARAILASEQCERLDIITIHQPIDIKGLHSIINDEWKILTAIERQDYPPLQTLLTPAYKKNMAFLFGPEGGFSNHEIDYLKNLPQNNFCTLGPRILRCETAALYGLSLISSHHPLII